MTVCWVLREAGIAHYGVVPAIELDDNDRETMDVARGSGRVPDECSSAERLGRHRRSGDVPGANGDVPRANGKVMGP
jgi:hypothetical protein